jgi:hypothetical protein
MQPDRPMLTAQMNSEILPKMIKQIYTRSV